MDHDMHVQEYYYRQIKVVGPNYYCPGDSCYQATIGDYDLDCKVGFGHSPNEAKSELMEKMGW